jgi:hypothetical protein
VLGLQVPNAALRSMVGVSWIQASHMLLPQQGGNENCTTIICDTKQSLLSLDQACSKGNS